MSLTNINLLNGIIKYLEERSEALVLLKSQIKNEIKYWKEKLNLENAIKNQIKRTKKILFQD